MRLGWTGMEPPLCPLPFWSPSLCPLSLLPLFPYPGHPHLCPAQSWHVGRAGNGVWLGQLGSGACTQLVTPPPRPAPAHQAGLTFWSRRLFGGADSSRVVEGAGRGGSPVWGPRMENPPLPRDPPLCLAPGPTRSVGRKPGAWGAERALC